MAKYIVEGMDRDGVCRASGLFDAAEPGEAIWDAQVVMMGRGGVCSYAVYRPARLRRRRRLLTVASGYDGGWGGPDGDGGLAGVREPRRPKPGPGHLSAAIEPPV